MTTQLNYGRRLQTFTIGLLLVLSAVGCTSNSLSASEFAIRNGRGVEVCDSYLVRLNSTKWTEPPYCDRPENAAIDGFAILNRVPLEDTDILGLINRVNDFTYGGSQDQTSIANIERRRLGLQELGARLPLESIQSDVSRGALRVWQYEPPVDIDNDGQSDFLIVWHGFGASHSNYRCGSTTYSNRERQVQLIYSVDLANHRVNEERTRALFTRADQSMNTQAEDAKAFEPIGQSMSIFKFKGIYYFDSFFSSAIGDFDGNRRNLDKMNDRLAVFERRGSATKQRCEFRWNRSKSDWR